MTKWLAPIRDPMIAVLVLAVLGAVVLPAMGQARDVARIVANAAIFLLFLVNGMRVPRSEVARGLRHLRYFVPLTLWVFVAMTGLGLAFEQVAQIGLPGTVAIGFLFLGVLPSTVQSATTYTTLAGGNIALGVMGAALLNIVGVFVSAPLFALLGGGAAGGIDLSTIWRIVQLLVVPFAIGQASQHWTASFVARHKDASKWLDRFVIGTAVYVAFSGAVANGIGGLGASGWVWLIALVLALLVAAHGGAWLASGALGLARPDRIAFLFAGGQKSVAIGAPLAALIFPVETAGFVIAPLLFYHLSQLVLAAPLATRLAAHRS